MSRHRRIWLLLALAAALVTLAAAPLPHFDGDTMTYGRIAKNVLRSGEWLTLHHHQGWVVDKPPLTIWLMAVSLRVGGATDTALRLWQLLFALGLAALVYGLARLAATREEGALAALIFLTTTQVFYQNLIPQQDVALTFFLALTLFEYLRYLRDGRRRSAILMGLWLGLAALTKGTIGVAAVGLIVAADLLLSWRSPVAFTAGANAPGHPAAPRRMIADAALTITTCLLVAAPWFVIGILRQGMPFVDTFFLRGTLGVGRFMQPLLAPPLPPWQAVLAYVPILALGMLPWTGLLPGAILEGWRALRMGPRPLRLLALWGGLYFLVLSLSPGDKVLRYLHACYPPLAVFAAIFLTKVVDQPRRLRIPAAVSLAMALPGLAGVLWLVAGRFPREFQIYVPILLPPLALLVGGVAAFAVQAFAGRGRQAVALLAATTLISYGVLEWTMVRRWESLWPWGKVGETIQRLYQPGDRIVVYPDPGVFSFAYYHLDPSPAVVADEGELLRRWERERLFALLPLPVLERIRGRAHPVVLVTMDSGWVLATNTPVSAPQPSTTGDPLRTP